MKNCCIGLNEHVMKITDFERLKMLPLIEEEKKIIGNKNFVIYVEINLIMI